MSTKKEYIGDGVYLSDDGYQLWLAVNSPSNEVVALDPTVFLSLIRSGAKRLFKDGAVDFMKSVVQSMEQTR